MEAILETQNQIMSGMDQLFVNFKKDGRDRKTPDYIKRKLETLDSYWQEFHSNHIQLCSFGDTSIPYFTGEEYERTKNFYTQVRQFIQNYQAEAVSRPTTPIIKPATPLQTSKTNPLPSTSGTQQKSEGTNSKLDEMIRKQKSNFKAFARTVENINFETMSDKWEYEDALKMLDSRWGIIDCLHWEIDSELSEDYPAYEAEFIKHESSYMRMKKAINTKIWSVAHRDKSTPQMEIPTFSGNYQQWMSFKDLFQEAIHNNPSLSNAQKHQFLKSKLRGEAEKLIQHLSISSENYLVSWELLNNRFNNKKIIFTSHINTLLGLPTMQTQTSALIKRMHDTTNECLHAVQKLGVDTTSWDPLIVHLLAQKLDVESHNDYIESLKNPREIPNLADFLSFLESKFTSIEAFRRKQENTKPAYQEDSRYKKPYHQNFNKHTKIFNKQPSSSFKSLHVEAKRCPHCSENHAIYLCKSFRESRPETKQETISKFNLCKNCLINHRNSECLSSKTCRYCNAKHNSLIHDIFESNKNTLTPTNKKAANDRSTCHVAQQKIVETLLATAIIKVQAADGSYQKMRAIIDQGSQTSLITEDAAQRLRLNRKRCKGVIFGIGVKENSCKGVIDIQIMSLYNDFSINTDVFIMNSLINRLPNQSFAKPSWEYLENIDLADPEFYRSRQVDLLLGADVYSSIIMSGIIKISPSHPVAQETQFGWILCGNVQTFQCNVVINQTDELQRFWEIENLDQQSDLSESDDRCIKFYQSTTVREADGRYSVRLPMKPDFEEKLGKSKPMAIAQFYQLEKRFHKNNSLAKDYKLFIDEYRNLGHMIPSTADANKTIEYFFPHHSVERPESTTTSLRVVFNGAAKTSSGFSLNDLMEVGPNLQQDLMTLLLKWRQYQYAFVADIEKMFRQINVNKCDQNYQKIVWRDDPTSPLQEYNLTTVTYGTKAAPFLAMMTLKQLAKDEKHNYQETNAAKVLDESMYMDDLLHGCHSIPEGVRLQSDLIQLLKSGGFNLRKWKSNVSELIPKQNLDQEDHFNFKPSESTKTLGLRWNPQSDYFTFDPITNLATTKHTKRTLLSDISKVFDPEGWLSPLTTKLKILFQNVWQAEIDWDGELPENILTEWLKVKAEMGQISHVKVPRWLGSQSHDILEFHGFCDASTKAYAAVIYCKVKRANTNESSVVLVIGKARLVPVSKSVSLPKLELCGALLLSQAMKKVKESYQNYTINIHGWVDSKVVLGWLNGEPGRWKSFVANRVRKITDIMPPACWQYVKSEENPADCASRGLNANQLIQHPLWWQGPAWLSNYEKNENQNKNEIFTTDLEKKISKNNNTNLVTRLPDNNIIQDLITRCSTLTRAMRILCWILRWRNHNKTSYFTVKELNEAKQLIIRTVQNAEFFNDITQLTKQNQLDKKSTIAKLNPFLDKEGLLRVGGRLANANIEEAMKHPIIIPNNHRLTELLIDHAHNQCYHGGARLTLAFLRRNYWIVGGNRATKKRLRLCVTCRRHQPDKKQQLMGDLPEARSNPSRTFFHVGVDYTGSILIKSNKGRGIKTTKGYVAVFVCMATKAVHLELVSDLSTSAFLAALRRMIARRGKPGHIYSDNGTNFVGASRVLDREMEELKHTFNQEFMAEVAEMEINWHFNAPSWPTAGGLWEAAVKSLKYHLKRVIGEQKLTYEELTTILTQIEACLNSRPLCTISEDPEDLNYLTPSHFLSSGPILTIYETERDERTRWQLTQRIFQDIWRRWQTEYLTQLSARSKWQKPTENIKLNDVVIIHDDNLPAGKWSLGRVIELHPGKDGYVRVVTLKTKNGTMKRPILKLSVLPVSNNQEKPAPKEEPKPMTTPSETRCTKKKGSYLTMLLMLFAFLFSPVHGSYNIFPLKNNNSMYYFDKISTMNIIRDEWKLVVYYDLSPYWEGTILLSKYLEHLKDICSNTQTKAQCDIIMLQLGHSSSEYDYYNHILLGQQFPAHATTKRRRRGLINGVGYVAHSLFGILDESFAQQYTKDIQLIHENEKHLELLWRNQTSVVEAEYNLLKRTGNSMNAQFKMFNQHLNSLEKAANEIKTKVSEVASMNDFAMSAIIANNILNNLRNTQDMLLETITDIYHGNFNIHLLTPRQLLQELNLIAGRISKDLSLPIDNLQVNLNKIYHLLKVKARLTKEYLLFEIKIPLVSRDLYDVYKIIPIPRKNGDNMVTLPSISEYVAINLQKDLYLPLTAIELQTCYQYENGMHLCPLQTPLFQFNSDQSLCMKDSSAKTCKTKTIPCEQAWTQLHEVNTYLLTVCGEATIRIMCDQLIAMERVTKASVISLGNGCVIKGDSFTIMSHKRFSNNINIQPDVMTPDIPYINNIINVTIPNTTVIDTETSGLKNDLKLIGEQIKDMKSERGVAGVISYHDVHHYVAIYLVVAVAVVVGLAWSWRRARGRRAERRAAAQSELDGSQGASASVQCVSVQKGHLSDQCKSVSIEASKPSISDDRQKCSERVDKATMPNFRNHFRATN